MQELIEFLAKSLVEAPDAVQVFSKDTRRTTILKLQVAPDDMGRVIGKHGRVASAMRSLLTVAARHENRDVILEID
ncbi:KH domain-containing protein [soil metagenome]